ncbi:MAG: hypothetical protein WD766_07745 [Gemmatimonadota bacterium]
MTFDVLVLNSGEWLLSEELPAEPWHVLIYRQRGVRRNELHLWLPRRDATRSGAYAFRRYWVDGETRWCVEVPPDPDGFGPLASDRGKLRVRFTGPDGHVLWSEHRGPQRLADLTDADLRRLRVDGRAGPFSRI